MELGGFRPLAGWFSPPKTLTCDMFNLENNESRTSVSFLVFSLQTGEPAVGGGEWSGGGSVGGGGGSAGKQGFPSTADKCSETQLSTVDPQQGLFVSPCFVSHIHTVHGTTPSPFHFCP